MARLHLEASTSNSVLKMDWQLRLEFHHGRRHFLQIGYAIIKTNYNYLMVRIPYLDKNFGA